MATKQTDKCPCGNPHPQPTLDEREEMHAKLYAALQAISEAWGYANRTPAFHYLTDDINPVQAAIIEIKRFV